MRNASSNANEIDISEERINCLERCRGAGTEIRKLVTKLDSGPGKRSTNCAGIRRGSDSRLFEDMKGDGVGSGGIECFEDVQRSLLNFLYPRPPSVWRHNPLRILIQHTSLNQTMHISGVCAPEVVVNLGDLSVILLVSR
ncbi:hypothetical protein RRG08_004761 [Elysia crispata]|uniref:Uncharacterized protein n=1 Tax=Elysia crispata TaxID=231223 RepID=A0AAE1AJP3_9GAST|nr:hypothetical protein RRG08_004761 [Elysia crispata]